MKFIVSSVALLKKLQIVGGVINSSNTIPVLDHFLFELENSSLTITASDLETTMSTTIDVDSESKGKLAIPSKLLLDTLKTFPEQPLTFVILENNIIEINSNHGKYALAYSDGEQFPKTIQLDNPSSTKLSSDVLLKAINNTLFAAGNDDLRPVMSGVFFQLSNNNLTFVATDAHKLVKYTRSDFSASETAEFIMPKKPLNLLKTILGDKEYEVAVEYNNSNAKFILPETLIICRLIDGNYPNYEAVIPKENPNVLTIDRIQFLNSVKRVSIFSNKTTHQIRLRAAGAELNISAEDLDFSNKAEERLTCDYQGDDIQIGFNSRFLLEMLNNLESSEIRLEMSLPNRAGILKPTSGNADGESITMLVMPVMLNS
ncbi:DNA polymerase III subunit beta [Flavobacteriaceae bacterium]|jgi:DNA polymerase-3 subunit beta|nr:DNA polymerase III subunit beta [Flavobacteriaceae bacterium]MDC0477988.1 DNA polymerase III subunit beta [Flavobacteriaceae bacterium]MDC1371269.1 DNA polymerase III subunit beta [Flavobacteriaceae bacterium]